MLITYKPASGSAVQVAAIFDAAYVLTQGSAEAGVETVMPAVFLRLAGLPTDPEVDDPIITIDSDPTPANNADYRVVERRTAGMGAIVLCLRKVT